MEAKHHFPILLPLFESGLFLFRDILSCAKFFLLLGTHLFGLNAFETGVVLEICTFMHLSALQSLVEDEPLHLEA